jgi:hypothetical protein
MPASTSIRLPPDLKAEASTFARQVGTSLAGLIGIALRDYLDARSQSKNVLQEAGAPPVPAVSPGARAFPTSPAQGLNPKVMPEHPPVSKVGANQPCPCGSGKKYKHCGGSKV